MNRRAYLAAAGTAGLAGLAGCSAVTDVFETRPADSRLPALAADRPDAIYRPTHTEGMVMAGRQRDGPLTVGLTYSFPHRFWTVTGSHTAKVGVIESHSAHLMATVWDRSTDIVLPLETQPSVVVRKGGESVVDKRLWQMLSQQMGFHYGDNVELAGDGTYTASVTIPALGVDRYGAFADLYGSPSTVEVEFEFTEPTLEELGYETIPDAGTRGAVAPVDMQHMPVSTAPAVDALPGETVLDERSGGVRVVVQAVEADRFPDGTYLAVSPRTRYNQLPVPLTGLAGSIGGQSVEFSSALDPELALHYGASVDALPESGSLEVRVTTPPQAARHEGYETAFFDLPAVSAEL